MAGYNDQQRRAYNGGVEESDKWYDLGLPKPSNALIVEMAFNWCAIHIEVPCSVQERESYAACYINGFLEHREKALA